METQKFINDYLKYKKSYDKKSSKRVLSDSNFKLIAIPLQIISSKQNLTF